MDTATVHQLRDWLAALAAGGRPVIVDLDRGHRHRRGRAAGAGHRCQSESLTVVHEAGPGAVTDGQHRGHELIVAIPPRD
jgi:hypothetical protein